MNSEVLTYTIAAFLLPVVLGFLVYYIWKHPKRTGTANFPRGLFRYRSSDMVPLARHRLIDSMEDAMLVLDRQDRIVDVNRSMRVLLEVALEALGSALPENLAGRPAIEVLYPWRRLVARFRSETDIASEVKVKIAEETRFFDLKMTPILDGGGRVHGRMMVLRDITRLKQEEKNQKMVIEILDILNHGTGLQEAVGDILAAIKRGTGFDAVGIRLRQGDDFPYFVHDGFAQDFLEAENSLTDRGPDGGFCRDADGNVRLACLCGMVLSGKTDTSSPLFTEGGSAWTNDSLSVLSIPPGEDPRFNPRNRCFHEGFNSVAIVPIRVNRDVIGLLQLNDRRKNRFSAEMISFFEGLTASIGVMLQRRRYEDAVLEQKNLLGSVIESASDAVFAKDSEGRYVTINTAGAGMLGYRVDEIIGRSDADLLPEPIACEFRTTDEMIMSGGRPVEREESGVLRGKKISFLASKTPWRNASGEVIGVIGITKDISGRTLAENIIRARLRLIEFAADHSLSELLQKTLDEVCDITDSPIGFYHFVEPDQTTLSLQAWSTRTEKEFCTATGKGSHYSLDRAGVWVDCVHQRRPVIHNDYESLSHRKGLPEGHARVIRELVVPILREDKIVAILGVGNREVDYTDADIELVSYFADVAWEIALRKRSEEELRKNEKIFRERNIRMEKDLKIAQAAQKGIIQAVKPTCDRMLIEYRYRPLEKVGGDYYSFYQSEDVSLGFFIGDVSGHGLAAALFTTLLKSTSDRMFGEFGMDPSEYLKNLNGELIDYMASYFVTGIYGVLDPCKGEGVMSFRFSNGGHPVPVIMRAEGGVSFSGTCGSIIGIMEKVDYAVNEERLSKGDRLFVYTDGIPEAVNESKEIIGFDEGMLDLFRRSRRESLSDTLDAVMEEIHRFRGAHPLQDDITLIGFEVV